MKALYVTTWLLSILFANMALAGTPDGATIAHQGNGHGAAPCVACHAADGGGQAAAGFPRLAGLPEAYVRKQLEDFVSGSRANATMQPVASALSEAERDAVAKYYSELPIPSPANLPSPTGNSTSLAQTLATRGRWSKGLPACEQCHGPGGIGVGEHFPPLAGQSSLYLSNEIHAWQQGSRHNDPMQLMQTVASKLSDEDVNAISTWYAAQPVALKKEGQP